MDKRSAPLKKKPKELLVQQQDDILIIKINRSNSKNALNRNAVYELMAAVEGASNNNYIKVVVITGVGDIYTAGNDLKQIAEYKQPEDYYRGANYVLRALIKTFIACPKLLVCLVNGPCIGIGFTLSALCDAVYCTKNAYFQTPFSQLGLCPEACSSWTFPRQFGLSWSTKLLIFGEKLSAEKAEQLGFVLEVYDNNHMDVEEKFWPKIREYAKLSESSLRATKRLIRAHYEEDLMRALYAELKEIEKLRRGPVFKQAVEKFVHKSVQNVNKSKL
ncbi:enoyl-CoA delta isomerase 3, peroxisomal-like [Calliphora vicina]|uniref:enoyl-CoA delta isomerase 3, peroxisomal-like n=1 Tax=Calliphora vicina TaxID=7373 RepID=UPI00325BD88C